jgi:hypothetical protein
MMGEVVPLAKVIPQLFSINGLILATLLSLGLHAVFVLWVGKVSQAEKRASLPSQRLQLTLRASPQPVPLTRASGTNPEVEPPKKKPVWNPRSKPSPAVAATPSAATEPAQVVPPPKGDKSSAVPTESEPPVSALPNPEKSIQMNMDRPREGLNQSSQKGLATRANEQLNGSNARVSAFEQSFNRQLASANQAGTIVSETALSDGSRLVKFSGGTCMRFPNPAIATSAKPVQAIVTTCD